ncbi:hypothetical protein Acr_00g0053230 [Actinidia rufa]|uniref:Uncharacterized protein n=1 Tax=Actinidia rufa TaxID=165716 RepID=A0A7J0DN96_9ERIC|nr:hypothetical protein Acr_00g0053230 [Actinidia rufa]
MLGLALERAGSEFSDATLATGAGNTIWSNNDRKKGLHADISAPTDFSGQSFFGSRNSESYFGWLAEHKFERNNEFEGSILKGTCMKNGKKQVVFDGNRRNTYQAIPFITCAPRPLAFPNPAPDQVSPSQLFSLPGNSCKVSTVEMAGDKSLEDTEREDAIEKRMPTIHSDSDSHPSKPLLSSPVTPQTPFLRINLRNHQ